MRSLLWVSVLSAALAGCVADAGVAVQPVYVPPPQATVTVSANEQPAPPPQEYDASADVQETYVEPTAMVYVNPDVQVIEDYDYPVFYTGGLYWRNDGGVWYSSSWHDRGWNESREVPVSVRGIQRPEVYVHYRANVNARPGQPGYRNVHPIINHPSAAPTRSYAPGHPPANMGHGPVVTHPNEGYHPTTTEQAHPEAHPAAGGAGYHTTEAPHPEAHPAEGGAGYHTTEAAHPEAHPAEGGYHTTEAAHPPAKAQAPANKPAPQYKAAPPAKKKK